MRADLQALFDVPIAQGRIDICAGAPTGLGSGWGVITSSGRGNGSSGGPNSSADQHRMEYHVEQAVNYICRADGRMEDTV